MMLVSIAAIGSVVLLILFYFIYPHFHARVDQFLYGSDETSYQINRAMEAFQNGNLVLQQPRHFPKSQMPQIERLNFSAPAPEK